MILGSDRADRKWELIWWNEKKSLAKCGLGRMVFTNHLLPKTIFHWETEKTLRFYDIEIVILRKFCKCNCFRLFNFQLESKVTKEWKNLSFTFDYLVVSDLRDTMPSAVKTIVWNCKSWHSNHLHLAVKRTECKLRVFCLLMLFKDRWSFSSTAVVKPRNAFGGHTTFQNYFLGLEHKCKGD